MSTQKSKKTQITSKINNAINNAKKSATKANDFALNTTEEVVVETINIAEEWHKITEKALKGGVKLLENQQNLIFDALETLKTQFHYGKKRCSKIFAK